MENRTTLPPPTPHRDLRPLLYVEDEQNDVEITRIGLKMAGITHPLQVVRDGQLAIDYLAGSGEFADRLAHPMPCLILLDLNLPLVSGMEVLAWVRSQPHLRSLPVIIFTSSDHESDRRRARELGADDYLTKPNDLHHLRSALQELNSRWLSRHCAAS